MEESNSGYSVSKPGMAAETFNASTGEMDTGGPSGFTGQPESPNRQAPGRDVVPQNSMESNKEDMWSQPDLYTHVHTRVLTHIHSRTHMHEHMQACTQYPNPKITIISKSSTF